MKARGLSRARIALSDDTPEGVNYTACAPPCWALKTVAVFSHGLGRKQGKARLASNTSASVAKEHRTHPRVGAPVGACFMNSIIYLVGVIVIVLFILSYLGLR